MKALELALKKAPIVYVTRDIERALGLPAGVKNYVIITNATPFAKEIAKGRQNVMLVGGKKLLDTRELLAHSATKRYVKKLSSPRIVVFKNTQAIERECLKNGWQLLNPSAVVASAIEEKISQVAWLGPLQKYLPPHRIVTCKQVRFTGTPFIMQFNRAHTGSGTMLISNDGELAEFQNLFPDRPVRITEYITGPLFTNNNVVWDTTVLTGNISCQITGLPPFTSRPFATIGNDWKLPHHILNKKQLQQFNKMATDIGKQLQKSGWRGLFGIDVVLDAKTKKLYLIEINARQPASTTYESELQQLVKKKKATSLTTFAAHLSALLELPYKKETLAPISDGAQVVQKRITNKELRIKECAKKLKAKGFNIISYTNTEPESDWLRIQSKTSLMKNYQMFNEQGAMIQKMLAEL